MNIPNRETVEFYRREQSRGNEWERLSGDQQLHLLEFYHRKQTTKETDPMNPEKNITATPRLTPTAEREAERERLRTAQEKRNAEAASQRFEKRDEKTQNVLSFQQGEVLPLKGGWFRVIEAKGREITLELVGYTSKTKKLAKKMAKAFERYQAATTEGAQKTALKEYLEAGGKIDDIQINYGTIVRDDAGRVTHLERAVEEKVGPPIPEDADIVSAKIQGAKVHADDCTANGFSPHSCSCGALARAKANYDELIDADPILAEMLKDRINAVTGRTFTRAAFISDAPPADPPNSFTVYSRAHGCWFETDEHLRRRITEDESDNVFDGDDDYINNPDDVYDPVNAGGFHCSVCGEPAEPGTCHHCPTCGETLAEPGNCCEGKVS